MASSLNATPCAKEGEPFSSSQGGEVRPRPQATSVMAPPSRPISRPPEDDTPPHATSGMVPPSRSISGPPEEGDVLKILSFRLDPSTKRNLDPLQSSTSSSSKEVAFFIIEEYSDDSLVSTARRKREGGSDVSEGGGGAGAVEEPSPVGSEAAGVPRPKAGEEATTSSSKP